MDHNKLEDAFGPLADAAVADYLTRLQTALPLPATDAAALVCTQVRGLLDNDLHRAFTREFTDLLTAGRGVRVSADASLSDFRALLKKQLENIVRHATSDGKTAGDLQACVDTYLEIAGQVAGTGFPANFDELVALETRRLAGVPLTSPAPRTTGRLFQPAPHDSLWPRQPRPRLVDENSVSAPTYRPGSYYHR